jgi:hypothetical protein
MKILSNNSILQVIALLSFIIFLGCRSDIIQSPHETKIDDINSLIHYLKDPPSQYRSAPFWVWHELVSEDKIKQQLEAFKEQGFGGVFVHPRYGMITEYLSDEWFDLFDYTLKVAEELGLYVWIYDENSYPSGFAGGLVPHDMPESYKHGQALRLHRMNIFQPDSTLKYLHYYEVNSKEELIEIDEPEKKRGNNGKFILYEIVNYPQSKWYAGYSYVDLLYPGVTEKFLEITMQGYEKRFGNHFGNLIPGVFTDEPNIAPPGRNNVIRWTPDLFDEFYARWNYRLEDNLISLFEETGDWKKIRHNYFQLLLQMFINRWSKPWFEYTEKNGLNWTGHYWEHGWPSPHHGGDNMAMYAWHQIPGIDLLFNTMYTGERPDQFGRIRNVKELRSVANQTGKTRTLAEAYGGSGWDLTFEDMKRLGDWMYVLGVNFLNQHLTFMTLLGDRKHDYPQSFSYHTPWWDLYKYQADYFARLSVAMSAGKQTNNILVLEPTSSAWMYYAGQNSNHSINEIGDEFHNLLDTLERHKIAYDLGSENIIKDIGKVVNRSFIVGEAVYNLLVLPYGMENIDKTTFDLIESFLNSGGKVVSIGNIPDRIDGASTDATLKLFNKYPNQWVMTHKITDAKVANLFKNENIEFCEKSTVSEWFFHHLRKLDDGNLLFLVNSEPTESVEGDFLIKGKYVYEFDPFSGEIYLYPSSKNEDRLQVNFSIHPAGSLLLIITENKIPANPYSNHEQTATSLLKTNPSKVSALSPNFLILDYGNLLIEEQDLGHSYYYAAANQVWQHFGFQDNLWDRSIQFKTGLVDADTFQQNTGFEFIYDFNIKEGTDRISINSIAERPEIFKLSVNNTTLSPVEGSWSIEKDFARFNIGEYLHTGINKISLKVEPMSIYAELQPIYLTGNFSLSSSDNGWEIGPQKQIELGSWKNMGYPFYYDRVAYIKTVSFTEIPEKVVIQLGEWDGTVAEVIVNNQPAGIIQQPPYQHEIKKDLIKGENLIEVIVYGSLKNLLGPHHGIMGASFSRGMVRPPSFKSGPEKRPSGTTYDLLDYGLHEDFDVYISN